MHKSAKAEAGLFPVENQPPRWRAGAGKKEDCSLLLAWTEKCLSKYWSELYRSLEGIDSAVPMRALLGPAPDAKKMRFIDTTLEHWSGDLIAAIGNSGRREYALHVRKLVFAASYLGKLCRFASQGDSESYVRFLDEKIMGADGNGHGAAGSMLLKDRTFMFAIGMADGMRKDSEPNPFPDRQQAVIVPLDGKYEGTYRFELPDEMKDEREEALSAATGAFLGAVKWKLALSIIELRQAATYSLENQNGNGNAQEKNASERTLEIIDSGNLLGLLRSADVLKRAGAKESRENAVKFWKMSGNCSENALLLSGELHKVSGGKLARKISYLSIALSLLEAKDIGGAIWFWEGKLQSKVKERTDGVETGLAAKSLIEDKMLSLTFEKMKSAANAV